MLVLATREMAKKSLCTERRMRFALRLIFLSLNGGFDIESPKCSTTNKTGQILLLDVITTIFDLMVGLFSGKGLLLHLYFQDGRTLRQIHFRLFKYFIEGLGGFFGVL